MAEFADWMVGRNSRIVAGNSMVDSKTGSIARGATFGGCIGRNGLSRSGGRFTQGMESVCGQAACLADDPYRTFVGSNCGERRRFLFAGRIPGRRVLWQWR